MSANLYCWSPALNLEPSHPDFDDRLDALYTSEPPPSPRLLAFVNELLSRYPDLDDADVDTVWADGPMVENILGDFINMSLMWSRYEEAASFVIETARKHGLHCYDPQEDVFYAAQEPDFR